MSSVSVVEEKMDADFDEETPFSSSSPSSASKATNNTFNFETKVALPLPKSSIFNLLRTRRISRSIYVVLIKAKINMLLPFGPLAILLHYITGKHVCNIMLACLLAYFFLFNNYYCFLSITTILKPNSSYLLFLLGMGLLLRLIGYCSFGRTSWLCYWVRLYITSLLKSMSSAKY